MRTVNVVCIACSFCLAGGMAAGANGQFLPETIWVPVIFYDYHANFTNPDFESPDYSEDLAGLTTGMVKPLLNPDNKKPLLAENKALNAHLNDWFKPSGGTGATFVFDQSIHAYRWSGLTHYQNRSNEWVGKAFSETDSMANIVIYDSLPFHLIDSATGTYQFADSEFFPLDGRGFGAEPDRYPAYGWCNTGTDCDCPESGCPNHNYGFAMEWHPDFLLKPGLVFTFTGSDDVWAFVNGKLEMDLGGIHGTETASLHLDSIAAATGMRQGKSYAFDFFYAERHVTQSHIKITMNTIPLPILIVKVIGPDRVPAGKLMSVLRALIYNWDGGEDFDIEDEVRWDIVASTKQPGDSIYNILGDTCRFMATKAWRPVTIRATFTDPKSGQTQAEETKLYIGPGDPARVSIEHLPGDLMFDTAYNNVPNPVDTIALPLKADSAKVYAVIRDRFGNFVDFARNASWKLTDPQSASIVPVNDKKWIGIIKRNPVQKATAGGSSFVVAMQGSFIPDTVPVAIATSAGVSMRGVPRVSGIEVQQSRHGLLVRGTGAAGRGAFIKVLGLDGRKAFAASPGLSDDWTVWWDFRGAGAKPVGPGTYLLKITAAAANRCNRIVIGK